MFLRPKKDGNYRLILNLKQLNENIEYAHFKMEILCTALRLIQPGCYMGSVDLSDAYYNVNITVSDRKFLRFIWKGTLYQYTCLPNGLYMLLLDLKDMSQLHILMIPIYKGKRMNNVYKIYKKQKNLLNN